MDWNEGIYPFFSIEIIVHCQLARSIFLSVWESITAQFLTFVPPESKLLWRKVLLPRGQRKSSFFRRSAKFGNVSPFLIGATNTFSELIRPFIKLPNCVFKFYNLSEALGSFGLLLLRGACSGFVGVLPLPLIFDPPLYILYFTEKQC